MRRTPQKSGDLPPACRRREITLPVWFDLYLEGKMNDQGLTRSEVIRHLINESAGRHGRLARLEIRQRTNAIKLHCLEARARPSKADHHLAQIEQAADEIARLADCTGT